MLCKLFRTIIKEIQQKTRKMVHHTIAPYKNNRQLRNVNAYKPCYSIIVRTKSSVSLRKLNMIGKWLRCLDTRSVRIR